MSPAFASVLASARSDFNHRFAEARHRFPDLTPERFSHALQGGGDAIVRAAENARPGIAGDVGQVVFDAALILTGQRLIGPDARHPWVNTAWTQLLPALASHVAANPDRVIAAISNAACHLAAVPGARPAEWIGVIAKLGPQCGDIDALLALGQLAAWRAGLAHFRVGALEAGARLPASIVLAALDAAPRTDWSKARAQLASDPWFAPNRPHERGRLRLAARAGAFRGFGGLFREPPRVQQWQGNLLVRSADEQWLLTADAFGATFHRAEAGATQATGPAMSAPSGIKLSGTRILRGKEELDLADLGTFTSAAASADNTTLALTGEGTHAVALVALT